MKIRLAVFAIVLVVLVAVVPSWAGTINFADCSTVSTTKPVTCSGGSSTVWNVTYNSGIVATGYHYNGSQWLYSNLGIKNGGVDETGLGILADPSGDNEITANDAISLDLSVLGNGTGFFLNMESVQDGESYRYCWGTSATSGCVTSIVDNLTASSLWLTLNGADPFLYVSAEKANNGNVLVSSITVPDVVPEPSSMLLLGSGLFGLAGIVRRKISR